MSQLALIPLDEVSLLDAVRQLKPVHTGGYTMRDPERAQRIAAMFAAGRGVRFVAAAEGIGHETARACRRSLEESGALGPLKKRLSTRIGEIVADALDSYHDGILAGAVRPDQIPVGVGILLDKKSALDGEAQTVVEHRSVRAEVSLAELREMRRKLVSDVESGGLCQFAGVSGRLAAGDTVLDTAVGQVIEVGRPAATSGGLGSKGGGGGLGGAAGAEVVIGQGPGGPEAKGDA